MKVLVTGGCGFIGSYLVQALRSYGHDVSVIDRVAPKIAVDGVGYFCCDVRDPMDLMEAMQGQEAVVHLAATSGVHQCNEDLTDSFLNNVLATQLILDRIGKDRRLILASSCAVYGDNRNIWGRNSENCKTAPMSWYGVQKRMSEQLCRKYYEYHQFHSVVLRFFNVYGPGQNPESPYCGVISKFNDRMKQGKHIEIYGNGQQTRDYVYVRDVADAIRAALSLPIEQCDARPMNIGSGKATSVNQIFNQLAKINDLTLNANDLKKHVDPKGCEMLIARADVKLAKKILNWEPSYDLSYGLSTLR